MICSKAGAATTLARLLNEVARAMQDGLEQDAAIVCILDPLMQEVSRRWALVSQRSAAAPDPNKYRIGKKRASVAGEALPPSTHEASDHDAMPPGAPKKQIGRAHV